MKTILKKISLSMKRIRVYHVFVYQLFLVLMTTGVGMAQSNKLQNVILTFQLEPGKSEEVSHLFSEIEKEGEFTFAYSDSDVMDKTFVPNKAYYNLGDLLEEVSSQAGLSIKRVDQLLAVTAVEDKSLFEDQDKKLSGVIIDNIGSTIPGVNIRVKGTNVGTVSDFDGKFSLLNVAPGTVLVFSFMGYETQEILVGEKSFIKVTLAEATEVLSEVVVIGYGTEKKSDLTGAVSSLQSDDLTKVPVTSVDQTLQGLAPGVHVQRNQSQPGGAVSVKIRGTNSIQGDGEPLYVIDGFIGADFNSVDPNDIASLEVLKDASSTAIYGAQGGNGVIIITTKTGEKNMSEVNFGMYYGLQQVASPIDVLNSEEFLEISNAIRATENQPPRVMPDGQYVDTDWQDEVSRTAPMQNYNLSVKGGNEVVKYYASGNYINQQGVIVNTGYERFNLRFNLDAKLNKFLKLGLRLSGSDYTRTQDFSENITEANSNRHPIANTIRLAPVISPYDEYGNLTPNVVGIDVNRQYMGNPVYYNTHINDKQNVFLTNNNFSLDAKLHSKVNFRSTFGFKYQTIEDNYYKPSHVWNYKYDFRSKAEKGIKERTMWQSKNYATYNEKIGKHTFTLMGGFDVMKSTQDIFNTSIFDISLDKFQYNNLSAGDIATASLSSSFEENSRLSAYGRLKYNFKGKYLFTFNGRYDGSSKFGADKKWGFFPSAAVAWRLGDERFMKSLRFLEDLKLRLSAGISGSDALPPYSSLTQISSSVNTGYVLGGEINPGYRLVRYPNSGLTWEETAQVDIGVDVALFGNRLTMVVDYYQKQTNQLFLNRPIPTTNGVSKYRENIGSMMNEGFELGFTGIPIHKGKFKWEVGLNFTWQRGEVLDLGFPSTTPEDDRRILVGNVNSYTVKQSPSQILQAGLPLGSFFGYKTEGVWQEDEISKAHTQFGQTVQAGDMKFVDTNGDGDVNDSDRQVLAHSQPDYFGGFSNNFSYGGFDLSVFLIYSIGNKVLNLSRSYTMNTRNADQNKIPEISDYWTLENTDTDVPRLGYNMPQVIADTYIEDASFIKIREVTLGYRLPSKAAKKIKLKNLRVYTTITNPLFLTNYSGYDPEVGIYGNNIERMNTDNGAYPSAKSWIFGFNMAF